MTPDMKRRWYDRILAEARSDGDAKAACSRLAQQIRNNQGAAVEFARDLADYALRHLESECFQQWRGGALSVVRDSAPEPGVSWRRRPAARAFAAAWGVELAVGANGERVPAGETSAAHWWAIVGVNRQRGESLLMVAENAEAIARFLDKHPGNLGDVFASMPARVQKCVARHIGVDVQVLQRAA